MSDATPLIKAQSWPWSSQIAVLKKNKTNTDELIKSLTDVSNGHLTIIYMGRPNTTWSVFKEY